SAFDLVDGARHAFFADEGLVGGVVEDDGTVLAGVSHPSGELLTGGGGPGRVVRIAEVDQIHLLFGNGRDEIVFRCARQVDETAVGPAVVGFAGVAGHHIGVHVDRIDGIGDGDAVARPEDVENVAGVAF